MPAEFAGCSRFNYVHVAGNGDEGTVLIVCVERQLYHHVEVLSQGSAPWSVWLRLYLGRRRGLESDIYICCVCMPPAGSGFYKD